MWQVGKLLEDLLFPVRCGSCGAVLGKPGIFCARCRKLLKVGKFLSPYGHYCEHLAGIYFLYAYTGAVRTLLQELKFNGQKGLLADAAQEVKEVLSLADLDGQFDLTLEKLIVLPVPTDYGRYKARGYDIPTGIFAPWAQMLGLRWQSALKRIRPTKPQFGLSIGERKENVGGSLRAFGSLKGKDVLLVDDIFTTGSTMDEAARALQEIGAEHVYGVALSSGAGDAQGGNTRIEGRGDCEERGLRNKG